MRASLSSILAFTLAFATIADAAASHNLFHRITSPSSPSLGAEWTLRATLDLNPLSLDSNSSVAIHNQLSSEQVRRLKEAAYASDAADKFYQLALAPSESGTMVGEEGLMTSLRLCHLRQSHPDLPSLDDELLLTLRPSSPLTNTPSSSPLVTGLSYRILDITLDSSSCPITNPTKLNTILSNARKLRARRRSTLKTEESKQEFQFNTRLVKNEMQRVNRVVLKQAMPTNEDGTVKQQEQEKTFLQKYWFYLIPIAILLIMPPGDDESAKGSGGQGAGQGGAKKSS